MIARILFLVFLALFSHTENVAEDILVLNSFNKSLTSSVCPSSYIFFGEKIVLTASLNASQTNLTEWPFDIFLQSTYPYYKNICKISIKRDSCPGFTSDCGYCHYKEDEMYYLVFNITDDVTDRAYASYRCWLVDAKSETQSSDSVYVDVESYPHTRTIYIPSTTYSVENISSDTFMLKGFKDSRFEIKIFNNARFLSWRYSTETNYTNDTNIIYIDNLTSWDANVDNTINIKLQNNYCNNNWTITVPVTDKPKPDCDLPTLSRSNSSGTIVFIKCKMLTPYILWQPVICWTFSYPSIIGTVVIDGDLFICTVNLSMYNHDFGSFRSVDFNMRWTFLLDTQFTNGTKQLPRIVRFNINGTMSVTVEPGIDISFECKVYGNPSARAVLVGTGIGRIQENGSSTDLLRYTLTGVQCQDTGRYWCKGVSEFGTTPFENQGYVDVNVRCPPAIQSSTPSNEGREFYFKDDVMITIKVYGYPAPTEFSFQEQQRNLFVNVSKDRYTTKYVPLNPSLGLVNLLIFRNKSAGFSTYNLTIYSNTNRSVDFIFQIVDASKNTLASDTSLKPWLGSFIAVTCLFGLALIIIVYLAIKLTGKKDKNIGVTKVNTITAETTQSPAEETSDSYGDTQVKQSRVFPGKSDHSESSESGYIHPVSVPCDSNSYQELYDV